MIDIPDWDWDRDDEPDTDWTEVVCGLWREMLLTGTCNTCFHNMFPGEDE